MKFNDCGGSRSNRTRGQKSSNFLRASRIQPSGIFSPSATNVMFGVSFLRRGSMSLKTRHSTCSCRHDKLNRWGAGASRVNICDDLWDCNGGINIIFFLHWEMEFIPVHAAGPGPCKRSYHSCSLLGNYLYVYGGITEEKRVLNDLYRFDIASNTWTQIEEETSRSRGIPVVSSVFPRGRLCAAPFVSHHTATVVRDRYILLVGGWNGRKRTADVYCFDSVDHSWRQIPVSGEVPVGLSSHTATVISPTDILIIGREGGVRTQGRFTGAFNLNFETGKYTEAGFHVASRSGHTANLIQIRGSKERHLFVFGGRKSGGYELVGRWTKVEPSSGGYSREKLDNLLSQCTVCEEPSGRQHCQVVDIGHGCLLCFGGETWSGVRNNVTNEGFLLDTRRMKWYRLPVTSSVPRLVGHAMCLVADRTFAFGGTSNNGLVDTLWEVQLGGSSVWVSTSFPGSSCPGREMKEPGTRLFLFLVPAAFRFALIDHALVRSLFFLLLYPGNKPGQQMLHSKDLPTWKSRKLPLQGVCAALMVEAMNLYLGKSSI